MLHVKCLFYFMFLQWSIATPQINLYYTHWVTDSDNALQHDCVRIAATSRDVDVNRQIISYCISDLSPKLNVVKNDLFPKFTFADLSKQNITSQQLYLWSASIDIIERYQFYLNQLLISNESSMATEVFYNCTFPRFGSVCEYEFYHHDSNQSSLYEIIHHFYRTYRYVPTNFTCYKHLECNRGPFPICLDWSEICNGQVDCLDKESDEEHCWELDINQCQENEYQCTNGQCIPKSFHQDGDEVPDCLDGSDEHGRFSSFSVGIQSEPSFKCEDSICNETPLTSSCVEMRKELILQAMFSIKDNSTSDECWSTFKCIIDIGLVNYSYCSSLCRNKMCVEIIERTCPDMLFIPAVPVLYGHIYFAYQKNDSRILDNHGFRYPYVCYNNSRYEDYFLNASKVFFNNTTCYRRNYLISQLPNDGSWHYKYLSAINRNLWEHHQVWKYNQTFNQISAKCNRSSMYQCDNSLKCIRTFRLMDFKQDCPYGDDENVTKIQNSIAEDKLMGIDGTYDESCRIKLRYARRNVSFQTVCDGFTELLPVVIDGQNETDETECEQWQCNNIYTRCDGMWNCPNGADEVGCHLSPPLNCSIGHHICVSLYTNQLMCLSIEKGNDGKVDCLGATDELKLCPRTYDKTYSDNFHCMNSSIHLCLDSRRVCDGHDDCHNMDDEQFCEKKRESFAWNGICGSDRLSFASNVERVLCDGIKSIEKRQVKYFSLDELSKLVEHSATKIKNTAFSTSSVAEKSYQNQFRCHRGVELRVWSNNTNNFITNKCLCPPSFYGDQCQYQNQRVSLAIQFRALSDSYQTPFAIVISLIDDSDERVIHSFEHFSYLSMRDCKIKFNIYLLYSTRPKNLTKNYGIHIDIYEKVSLTHRTSLFYPVKFPFLPVYRLALIVDIPRSDTTTQSCSRNHQCVHGKCIRYLNNPQTATFCQCDRGWSGQYCTISHTSQCSLDSLCLGVSANNRSVCICPIHRFGSRCLIIDTICQTNHNSTCEHGGQCTPNDDYMVSNPKFICICPKGYIGDRCEVEDNILNISFAKNIVLSESLFIHFIEVIYDTEPIRVTTFKTIPVRQDSIIIYWSRPFHLVFIELQNKNYYLTVVQKIYNRSATTNQMINSSNRCPRISELFNETFLQWPLLRRIKYYHLSCQNQSVNLSCFYDDVHLCLCYDFDQQRLANCFKFNHSMTSNCLGQSVCENGGQCFQDHSNCPKRSVCTCLPCFYGTRCQFSTSGFGLSLDAILGYHILPHISLTHQPTIVQTSLALTIIFIIAGLLNGILCMITFKNESVREVGCGLYLLGSSITTLLVTVVFGLKFFILLFAQMISISNRSFLLFQCHSLDFLLRICLCMDQWLNACVAMERAITATKGVSFDKKKSKQAAKLVIILLFVVIVGSSVHDPISRRLIDEENDDEKRIWCTVSYSSSLQVFNLFMHMSHFFGPFLINLISAIILLITTSRQQANMHNHRPYKEHLRKQFRQHKHLFISPILLVILALPRLIIIFVSKCMKSTGDSWLFLIGYFISFIPPMLTFIIFIVPSKFYKKEFHKSIAYYRTHVRRRLHLSS